MCTPESKVKTVLKDLWEEARKSCKCVEQKNKVVDAMFERLYKIYDDRKEAEKRLCTCKENTCPVHFKS